MISEEFLSRLNGLTEAKRPNYTEHEARRDEMSKQILIADDNSEIRDAVRSLLDSENYLKACVEIRDRFPISK